MTGKTRNVRPIVGAVLPVPARSRRNWTEEDAKKAGEMGSRVPEYLCRYVKLRYDHRESSQRLRGYLEDTVRDSKLHFSHYAHLNDPFDGSFSVSSDADPETKTAYWTEAAQEQGWSPDKVKAMIQNVLNATPEQDQKLEDIVRGRFREHGVCCFSRQEDDRLAWSYYAGGHAGLCLRFRMSNLFQALGQSPGMLLEVQYKKDHPRERFYQPGKFNMILAAFCTKSKIWEHEGEWRLVLPRIGLVPFPAESLDGIILGCRINPDDEQFVRAMVQDRKPAIQLLRASMKEREYALRIDAIK